MNIGLKTLTIGAYLMMTNETLEHMKDSSVIVDLMVKWNICAVHHNADDTFNFVYGNDNIVKSEVTSSRMIEHNT